MAVIQDKAEERADQVPAKTEAAPPASRKPYQKPAFRTEKIFETLALSCGKITPTQSHCRFIRKSS